MTGKIDGCKEEIANLCFDGGGGLAFGWLSQLSMKLHDLFLQLVEEAPGVRPVEAHLGREGTQLARLEHRGHAAGDVVEHRGFGRRGGLVSQSFYLLPL